MIPHDRVSYLNLLSIRLRNESGHSLGVLVLTLAALAAVWAVVWLNVPRDLGRSDVPTPPPVDDVRQLIPPSLMEKVPSPAPVSPPAADGASSPVEATPLPEATRSGPVEFSDQGPRVPSAVDCREEVRKLCGEVEPWSGRFSDCMQQFRELLPMACQRQPEERVAEREEGAKALLAACRPDLRRWCPAIPLRGGPIIQCLRSHAKTLSTACTETLLAQRVL